MPATRPGIIFLRIPETWLTQSKKLKETVDRAIDQFFRNYQRIITVVVFWEEWHPQGRALLRFAKYQERVNTASRFYSVENTPLILSHGENVFVNQWRHLSEI